MNKKTFKAAPRPSVPLAPDAIDRFVNEGPGRDIVSVKAETQKSVEEPTARLTVDMPQSLHRSFKALCSAAGLRMNDEIRRFIEQRTEELKEQTRI